MRKDRELVFVTELVQVAVSALAARALVATASDLALAATASDLALAAKASVSVCVVSAVSAQVWVVLAWAVEE